MNDNGLWIWGAVAVVAVLVLLVRRSRHSRSPDSAPPPLATEASQPLGEWHHTGSPGLPEAPGKPFDASIETAASGDSAEDEPAPSKAFSTPATPAAKNERTRGKRRTGGKATRGKNKKQALNEQGPAQEAVAAAHVPVPEALPEPVEDEANLIAQAVAVQAKLADDERQAAEALEAAARQAEHEAQAQARVHEEQAAALALEQAQALEDQRREDERLAHQRLESQRLEAERVEAERLEVQRLESQRLADEEAALRLAEAQAAQARAQALIDVENAARAQREAAQARAEAEALQVQRLEEQRLEVQRLEIQRLEVQRLEDEAAAQRVAQAAREAQQLQVQRLEAQRREAAQRQEEARQQEAERLAQEAAHQAAQQAAQAAAALPLPPQTARAPEDTLVMVADDSKVVRVKTSRLLAQHHYRVVLAEDGEDARRKIELEAPHVLITDVEMPGLDGFELTRHVRSQLQTAHIPIIMITSADDRLKAAAQEAGVTFLLGKPYSEAALIGHIEQSIQGRASAAL
jgi:CheY-like chemotaxis protein